MKFEYENKTDDKECVAFIHNNGALVIKFPNCCVVINGNGGNYSTYYENFDLWIGSAIHKFYPGDKLTITF